jgi:polyhydroxyalkanoate synthesis regulator phasin
MIDLVKKAMFTGIGVMSLTKEKVEEIAGEFVAKGKLSEQEGKNLVNDLLERSEESKGEVKKQIEAVVKSTLVKMDIATKTDIDALKSDLADLRDSLKDKEK